MSNINLPDDFLTQHDENTFSINFRGSKSAPSAASSEHRVNGTNNFVIATDCDDVLVDISNKWFGKIKAHPIVGQYVTEEIQRVVDFYSGNALFRDHYDINEWLKITDPAHKQIALDLYFQDANFYDDLEPTPFARSLVSGAFNLLDSIHVVTTCGLSVDQPANISKMRWISKFFRNHLTNDESLRVKIHMLPFGIGKGKFMHENGIKFNTFVDDHLKNVLDVINNTEFGGYEVMIPCYGFNQNIRDMQREKVTSKLQYRIVGFHNTIVPTQQEVLERVHVLSQWIADNPAEEV